MEEALASMDGGLKTDSNSCCQHSQSIDELKQLLLYATVELDSAGAAARAQSQLHEARVRHLEELLKTTRRERDEARDQCKQWQWRMSQSPGHGSGSSGLGEQRSGVPSVESVSSVRSSVSPLESVSSVRTGVSQVGGVSALRPAVPHLESVSSMTEPSRATLTEVHRKLHEQQQQHELNHKLDSVSSVSAMNEPTRATLTEVYRKLQEQQQQQEQLEIQQIDIHQLQHHMDIHQLQMRLELQQESDQLLSQMQQRHSSETASLRLQDDPPLHRQLNQHSDVVAPISTFMSGTNDGSLTMPVLQHSSWSGVFSSSASSMLPRDLQGISDMDSVPCYMVPELSGSQLPNGLSTGLSKQLLQSSCLTGGSFVASILSPRDNRFTESGSASILLPRHLPEPPEADPQVMLNSLPEKGKLLQAVMQAGPLLQTLLLAGPLPQWRYPPPTMDSEEIPRVSMRSSDVISPPSEQSLGRVSIHSGRNQVMRLSTSNQTSPSQNVMCSTSVASVSASIGLSAQNLLCEFL